MSTKYELMVIIDPEVDERTVAPQLDKFLDVIRKDGGTVESVDIWGRRRLAYEIQKKNEGIYAVINFEAEAKTTSEVDRQLKLSEAVMRTKVLRKDEAVVDLTENDEAAKSDVADTKNDVAETE
ncbi:30S ribosomal protein S6 [Agrococcus casei]|uniref:Small ribosomal subunit protein bS6 n=1 Tax=Agrococcus casei LMG 22410 TaxID=1255656 RepID=A0A1R4ERC3_9MICO|nr:30S ribosomal protein S6 [Agrococcus casei]SJM46096.1 SSU ribosomal protein S6p [Agrococcus casei LMG 22410]